MKNKDSNNISHSKSFISSFFSSLKSSFHSIAQSLHDETKKDPEERSKSIQAFILTILIVSVIVFVCWKVPFLKNFFSH